MLQPVGMLVSFAGYFFLLYILLQGKKTALYPAIAVSCIVVLGFLSGLMGCMRHCFSFLYLSGIILVPVCIHRMVRRRVTAPVPTVHALLPLMVFLAGCVMLYVNLDGRFLYRYDDFSHWGKAAHILASEFRFPVEADGLSHGSYPPGSALFIAFGSSVVGASDGAWLFAQAVMMLALWVTLLGAGRNVLQQCLLTVVLIPLMTYNVPLESLHVDTLLAASAFAAFMCCVHTDELPKSRGLLAALTLSVLVLVKSSGAFLALVLAAFWLYRIWKEKRAFSLQMLWLLLPIALLISWNVYTGVQFGQVAKHQVSVAYYQKVLGEKTLEDIGAIMRLILPLMVSTARNHALWLIPGYLLVMFVHRKQGTLRSLGRLYLLALAIFLLYQIGMLLMYIFSMPMSEIISQNGDDYDRYNGTIVAFLACVLLYLASCIRFPALEKAHVRGLVCAGIAFCLSMGMAYSVIEADVSYFSSREGRIRKNPSAYHFFLLKDRLMELPPDASYVVLFSKEEYSDKIISRSYTRSKDVERCYEEATALKLAAAEPWRYYIDLAAGKIILPMETVGVELYPRDAKMMGMNVLCTVGYKENTRYSTSQEEDITAYHWDSTGHIPIQVGDVIRLQNVTWYPTEENESRGGIYWYKAEERFRSNIRLKTRDDLRKWKPVFDEAGNIVQITVPEDVGTSTMTLRIICQDINSNSVITINEEIP